MNEKESENSVNTSNCPICGYFVGINSTCPRCCARVKRRISVKAARVVALVGSVIGLILLWYAAYMKEPEMVNIAQVTETMNNALVRIEGEIIGIRYDEERNSLKITLNDGTGNIKLNAFNKLDRFRKELGINMPVIKDKISVTGVLNISQAWGVTMFLSIPSRIKIIDKYIVKEKKLKDISIEDKGGIYFVEVDIIDYSKFTTSKGHLMHKFFVGDETGELEMVLYENEFDMLPDDIREAMKNKWNRFSMRVKVNTYRNDLQLKIINDSNQNIKRIDSVIEEVGHMNLVKNISKENVGNVYSVTAKVDEVSLGTEGVFLKLRKYPCSLFIRYARWERITGCVTLKEGNGKITAIVRVAQHNEELVLRIMDFSKIIIEELSEKDKNHTLLEKEIIPEKNYKLKDILNKPNLDKKEYKKIDIASLKVKKAADIKKRDIGKIYMINEKVKEIELGADGAYIIFEGNSLDFFISYEDQEKIKDFFKLNTGERYIKAAVEIVQTENKPGLKIADLSSVRIE